MGERNSISHKNDMAVTSKGSDLIDVVFSWSLEDICNQDYYTNKVEKIPDTFQSVEHYFASFVYPLLEETRAELSLGLELISRAPFAEVICIEKVEPDEELLYNVRVDYWGNRSAGRCLDPYRTVPGDLVIFADAKLNAFSDVQSLGRKTWAFALVTEVRKNGTEDDSTPVCFKVRVSKETTEGDGKNRWAFMYFLINITTSERIWTALNMSGNQNIIKEVLFTDSMVRESCELCAEGNSGVCTKNFGTILSSKLNKSQMGAVLASLRKIHCNHKSSVELICGPPGTGKTRTISALLCALLGANIRTLTCAPTAVAVKEVASRVMKHLKESFETDPQKDASICSLGDLLFLGDYDSTAVGSEIKEIYLDHRVERLAKCFEPLNGWRHSFNSMIVFLEDGVSVDCVSEDELSKMEEGIIEGRKGKRKTYLQLAREQFKSTSFHLREVVFTLSTHMPKSFILEHNFQAMLSLLSFLSSFESLLHQDNMVSEELENLFSGKENVKHSSKSLVDSSTLMVIRNECLHILKNLRNSLDELQFPKNIRKDLLIDFCFQTASSIFSTASDSHKLHLVVMKPLNILVIDEAAQLKEAESTIPIQLPGIKLAILIGDKFQLSSTVKSNICDKAGFGRSIYERLSSLDHPKLFLNLQYRMHPSISLFPCSNFYANQILDAPNVKRKAYEKEYLPKPVFGPYSFINISCGREEVDEVGCGLKNMVEVAVLMKIVQNLYRAWRSGIKEELRIGVLSPYTAQVLEIQEKLRQKYENKDRFSVKVQTIDGFQGGEEDIILISTVRANKSGSVGVMADLNLTNVALTRARHCLWILGSERTLAMSETVWKDIVRDAKDRHCLSNADEDCDLADTILKVKAELDQLDDLLNSDSSLLNGARWKVIFSENFRKAFYNLKSSWTQNMVITLLLRLSTGWRPKRRNIDLPCESSSNILKKFKVGYLYIVCSNDLVKECSYYTQVLKVWDILPLEDIPKLVKHLDSIFEMYTDDYLSHCKKKCLEGELEIPMSWTTSYDIVQCKSLSKNATGRISNFSGLARRGDVENSIVSESFLIMKFYSLTCNMLRHLISGHDGRELDLPFELTAQEQETILFNRSSFILGRSGTGKTTVLTMKLFQKEQLSHIASEGFYEVEGISSTHASQRCEIGECTGDAKGACLHQLFVTVSPRLCNAIRRQLSHFQSFASGGEVMAESSSLDLDYVDDTVQFKDIPDSFVNIPSKSYPLVITFHKFLMMLDGTVGNSYFSRFPDAHKLSRTVTLQTFIRSREVNYERFISSYWPHFKAHLIKNLDSSAVFTEIISHIKGGIEAGKAHDGRLSREDYLLLAEGRVSTLSREQRDRVYNIFLQYEKKKTKKCEYDLSDLVMDLHFRLGNERYEGDQIDFVYIDEVQDLTMRQIALFKYVSKNIDEGFVFSGDTAQTIAKGVDFRFQDMRHLFFKEFLLGSRIDATDEKKEKGKISKIFHLSQNFRTHAGVLNLAQSVIDLLCHFFPLTIDVLNPETSLIDGEAPVLIDSVNFGDALLTIFGGSENAKGNVGFGAEQVILVRNDSAKEEISKYVGRKALVLTILECKGLEFRDVLLCNFFGSCPFKHHWRVLYQFMNKINLVSKSLISFPSFDDAKHNVLCSELKQLYVAITRTRKRLWICDTIDEVSKPMFEYWEKLSLIEVRCLRDLLAKGMQVSSSEDEWRSRGFKLFYEHNYEMARMCFEKAGDMYNEKFAIAANLQSLANSISSSSPQIAKNYLREAADMFETIGKAEYAAKCFYEMKDYERAGRIYMEKCGEPKLDKAGECFSMAGCYESAAEAYAKGNFLSECLAVCIKGRLFYMGLQFIQQWKQNSKVAIKESLEIHKIEQKLLEGCARRCHELKDLTGMMKYVRAFHSFESIRTFLRDLCCLDELLLIEKEKENFVEAANIAKWIGDISLEVEMLEKAQCFEDSSKAILSYVLVNSLWQLGSKGWPLKQFMRKEELVNKAKANAERASKQFYGFVCTEVDILSHEQSTLFELNQSFRSSQNHGSVRGEILSARKIIDAHLHLISTLEDRGKSDLCTYLTTHSEEGISSIQFSIETLVYFWNFWKNKIVSILGYLGGAVEKYVDYKEFCLSYLGVLKQSNKRTSLYLVLNPEADWVRKIDDRFLHRNGKLVFIDASQFVSAARSYWCSELLSVGIKILENLEDLYQFCTRNCFPEFYQSIPLIYIFDVTNFLMKAGSLHCWHPHAETLQMFLEKSTERFFGYIYPLDCRKSSTVDMVSLRENKLAGNLLREVILKNMSLKGNLTYGQIGRAVMIMLGSGELTDEFAERFNKDSPWKDFIKRLCVIKRSEVFHSQSSAAEEELSLILKLREALDVTYNANWRKEIDFVSPVCFLYLVERQLFLVSYCQGYVFTTKALVVEWLIFQQWKTTPSACSLTDSGASEKTQILGDTYSFMASIVLELLRDEEGMVEWLEKSNTNLKDYPVLVLRLVVIMCLICVNSGKHFDLIFDLLSMNCISSCLPKPFYNAFLGRQKCSFVEVLAEALKQIESVLVIVSWENNHFHFSPDAILVDAMVNQNREGMLSVLFPKNISSSGQHSLNYSDCGNASEPDSSNSSTADQNLKARNEAEGNDLQENYEHFRQIFDVLKPLENVKDAGMETFTLNAPGVLVLVEKSIDLIVAAMTQYFQLIPCDREDENIPREPNMIHCEDGNLLWHANRMVDGFKQLSYLLNCGPVFSGENLKKNMSNIQLLLKKLQSGKVRVEPFMRQICLKNDAAAGSWITEDNSG